jgi:hypothetical protein
MWSSNEVLGNYRDDSWKSILHPVGLEQSRTRDLTFDAVRIVEIHTPAFTPGREAGGFESRDSIGWIVIRDAVAVVMQAGLLALEERQPASAGGEEAFFSPRFQAKVFLIPFLRTLHVAHT